MALRGERKNPQSLRDWTWGGDGERDHSLYDKDGLTVARIVQEADGRYHLRTPIATPRRSWVDLDHAKRCAENFALMASPLEAIDPKLAARIKRDNNTPHPMGPPLNRPIRMGEAIPSDWKAVGTDAWSASGLEIPDFLRR